jgi:hypothetical protein
MITSDPPTITDLILSLGVPQNYAEQSLIHQMRRLERRSVNAADCSEQAFVLWTEAHTIAQVITCFRQYGARPPIDGYERMADRLEREARGVMRET